MAIELKNLLNAIRVEGARRRGDPPQMGQQPVCYDGSLSSTASLEQAHEEPQLTARQSQNLTRRAVAISCVLSAIICAIALCVVLRVYRLDLHVPLTYWGDALYFDSWVKGLIQGHLPWNHPRLAAPFGADWRDFPINLTVEALAVRSLAIFTSSPGLVLNLLWLSGTSAAAGTAAYGLQRLGVGRWVAVALGVIYALQPFTFYHGAAHFNLLFYLVPLLATGAIEVAAGFVPITCKDSHISGRLPTGRLTYVFRRVPAYIYLGCLLQGLSYIYNSFFGVVLFATAAGLACIIYRRGISLVSGLLAVVVLCGATLINLAPNLIYWAEHGRNSAMAYKSPAAAEFYGLKIRHLLTPTPENPFPPLRYIEKKLGSAGFTGENENAQSRLGTIGSVGLLLLLAWAFISCVRGSTLKGRAARILGACSALTLTCLLLATVGGFGSLFNVFVAPDIRCYDRIVVFIDFFSITAVGLLLTRSIPRFLRWDGSKLVSVGALIFLILFGVSDQAVTRTYRDYVPRESQFKLDDMFTKSIESVLPKNASIFQLPFTTFPLDGGTVHMGVYDQSRPYLHSNSLRWSWGGVAGRKAEEWARQTSSLPVKRMLARLSAAGFSGIWIDRLGYEQGNSPEREIATALGRQPLQRSDGRIAFYDLRGYSKRLKISEDSHDQHSEEQEAIHAVKVTFPSGFYDQERNDKQTWRWCLQHGVIELQNTLAESRSVKLVMTLQTGRSEKDAVKITTSRGSEVVEVTDKGEPYAHRIWLRPDQSTRVSFDCECKPVNAPGEARRLYFALIDLRIEE